MPSRFIHSMMARRSSSTDRSMPLRADSAWRRNWMTDTPAISCGYWKARNMPALARTSVGQSVMSSPWNRMRPPVTSYSGLAEQGVGQRGLARAVRAHDGVHLAGRDDEVDAAEDLGAVGRLGRAGVQALDAQELGGWVGHAAQSISPTAVVETLSWAGSCVR